jgi:hypothetical protein
MKKTVATLALTAGLSLSCSAAFAVSDCTTTQETVRTLVTPAVPAVPGFPAVAATPPVYQTVTEYEFRHKRGDHPNSERWERDGWNADSNPESLGWYSTGNTREVATDVVLVPGKPALPAILGTPEIPAVYEDRVVEKTICAPVEPKTPTPEPEKPVAVAPVAEEKPVVSVTPAVTSIIPVAQSQPVAPTELAQTGAADWVLPAGLLAGLVGVALVSATRRKA